MAELEITSKKLSAAVVRKKMETVTLRSERRRVGIPLHWASIDSLWSYEP